MDDVSIEFEPGLVHSILGPNGCGKSGEVICPKMLRDVFQVDACVEQEEENGFPVIKRMKRLMS